MIDLSTRGLCVLQVILVFVIKESFIILVDLKRATLLRLEAKFRKLLFNINLALIFDSLLPLSFDCLLLRLTKFLHGIHMLHVTGVVKVLQVLAVRVHQLGVQPLLVLLLLLSVELLLRVWQILWLLLCLHGRQEV